MTKRLKLKVQRHRLPDVDILWPLKETEGRNPLTTAALLADIDRAIPLESGEWTLDQYVAELDGFECLHYAFVSDVFKDGDCVTVRPLGTPDVKARRLGGRTQITGEGFHIMDGVPFGMGPTQRPARPGVLIPSRKRRRPEMEEDEDGEGDITIAELEDDEELLEHVNGGRGSSLAFHGIEEAGEEDAEGTRPKKKQKNVHFKVVDDIPGFSVEEDDDEDEEDDEDFDPEGDAGTSEEGSEDDEDSASSDDDDSDKDDDDDDDSPSSSEVSSSDSSSDSDSDSDGSSLPEVQSTKAPLPLTTAANGLPKLTSPPKTNGIPYRGSIFTQERNKRRRNRSRLLKRVRSIIGENASVADCDVWVKENPEQATYVRLAAEDGLSDGVNGTEGEGDGEEEFTGFSESADALSIAKSAGLDLNGETGMPDVPVAEDNQATTTTNNKSPAFTKQRQNLLAALSSGGVLNSEDPNPKALTEVEAELQAEGTVMAPDTKRVRLNVDGSRRAIFGALGQRTPKTQQDAEKVRARLAGPGKVKPKAKAVEEEVPEEDPLSDAWRSKIKLMAVDCDDPSVKLSEPPYPFRQRWDVTQQREAHWWEQGGKKRKRKARNSYGHDGNWDEEEEGEESYLDYGEGEEGGEEYVEGETEEAGGDEAEDVSDEDDLASLPADITTLPPLTQADLVRGAIIAFKQLECTARTNWAPTLSPHRTARVLRFASADKLLEIELARRDRRVNAIKYDGQGRRLYEKFEMDAGDEELDENLDDGVRIVLWGDLVEGVLVEAAEVKEADGEEGEKNGEDVTVGGATTGVAV